MFFMKLHGFIHELLSKNLNNKQTCVIAWSVGQGCDGFGGLLFPEPFGLFPLLFFFLSVFLIINPVSALSEFLVGLMGKSRDQRAFIDDGVISCGGLNTWRDGSSRRCGSGDRDIGSSGRDGRSSHWVHLGRNGRLHVGFFGSIVMFGGHDVDVVLGMLVFGCSGRRGVFYGAIGKLWLFVGTNNLDRTPGINDVIGLTSMDCHDLG